MAVFRLGALGDILAIAPALATLRALRPCEIILAGRGEGIRVVRDAGLADAVWDLDGAWAAPLFRGVPASPAAHADRPFPSRMALLGRYEAGLRDACRAARAIWTCTGATPPGRRTAVHHAAPWGAPDLGVPWLRSWALRCAPFVRVDGAFVVHPGSGSKAKNWHPDRWVETIDSLRRGGSETVVLVEGPADAQAANAVAGRLNGRVVRLANLPLPTVAATVARARVFLGNDSGIAHLAGLVGTPTVVVFGPANPAEWLPAGPRVVGVTPADGSSAVEGVDCASVVDAARLLLDRPSSA